MSVFDKRVEALRAKGQVVDLVGMQKLHAEKASPEMAAEWDEIFEELTSLEFIEESMSFPYLGPTEFVETHVPHRGEEWEAEADAKQFLTNRKALRDKLRKLAAQGKSVYFAVEATGQSPPECTAHKPIQRAIQLLAFDGVMTLRFNAAPVALEDVRALMGMRNLLRGEPSIMAFFISDSAEEGLIEIAKAGVEQHLFNEKQLRELLAILSSIDVPREHFVNAIEGERGELLASLEWFAKQQGFLRPLLGSPAARTTALDLFEKFQALKFDDLNATLTDLDAVDADLSQFMASVRMPTSADHMAPLRAPVLNAMARTVVNRQMQLRLARLAIGVELYRLKHQRLPESTAEVVDVGVDPVQLVPAGKKPFGFRLSEDKTHADLWGFALPQRFVETPPEPPENILNGSEEHRCYWKL